MENLLILKLVPYCKNRLVAVTAIFLLLFIGSCSSVNLEKEKQMTSSNEQYVTISDKHPGYFQLSDGTPYIPIGLNIIGAGVSDKNGEEGLKQMEEWMQKLSQNGGNFIRLWLSNGFWEVENVNAGQFNEEQAQRIDKLIELARKYDIRLKMTLEHFRGVAPDESARWSTKNVYHTSQGGPLNSIDEYMTTEEGRQLFLNRIDFFAKRYGSDPVFFGWELWNEINAMANPEDAIFYPWHHTMLTALKKGFPQNLAMQSLGSFDREHWRKVYQMLNAMDENEVAQIHRYLDLGADMEICHAPMDVVASSAVRELHSYNLRKPIMLAETGGVEPRHTGPIRYYKMDKDGVLLHDALFAPFFAGAAGGGQNWHWNDYVDANNLWYHYGRFSTAIKGINPIEEQFLPVHWETGGIRVYALKGGNTIIIWARDKENSWSNEFEEGNKPRLVNNENLDIIGLTAGKTIQNIEFYNPWDDKWTEIESVNTNITQPTFSRSLVVKIKLKKLK